MTVVHPHELFAAVLEQAVAAHDFRCDRVITSGLSTQAVLRSVARWKPDVVVAALQAGRSEGVDVLRSLCGAGHAAIALLEDEQPLRVGEALAAGAVAVVARSAPLTALLDSVEQVMRGERSIEPARRAELVDQYRRAFGEDKERVASLSRQEKDLLAHLMRGRDTHDIARIRFVAPTTVRTQSKAVLSKLGVSSQLTAVAVARRAGYTPDALHAHHPPAS